MTFAQPLIDLLVKCSTFFLAVSPWLKVGACIYPDHGVGPHTLLVVPVPQVSRNSCVDLEGSGVAAHPFYPGYNTSKDRPSSLGCAHVFYNKISMQMNVL